MSHDPKPDQKAVNAGRRECDMERYLAVRKQLCDLERDAEQARQTFADYQRLKDAFFDRLGAALDTTEFQESINRVVHAAMPEHQALIESVARHQRMTARQVELQEVLKVMKKDAEELAKQTAGFASARNLEPVAENFAPKVFGLLRTFRWFCSKENKEHVELILADLKSRGREMRHEGRSVGFIRVALIWEVLFGAVLPITTDAIIRFLKRARKISDLLTTKNSG